MPSATTKTAAHAFQTDDPRLHPIHEKVLANHALNVADVADLYASKDILAIGWLANHVRERMHGHSTNFSVDSVVTAQSGAGDEIVVLANDLEQTLRGIERLKKEAPRVRIAAWTVEEIAAHANPEGVVKKLRDSGADALVGQGAEVFLPAIRRRLWHHAGTFVQRAAARQIARDAGLQVPLYSVQRNATPDQQSEELLSFRSHPGETFSALSFDPDASTSLNLPVTTGMQEMKQIAIARLALDNVTHIRAYWQMLGGKLIQIALRFGASYLDGTALDANVDSELRRRELAREISVAGREPQEMGGARRIGIAA